MKFNPGIEGLRGVAVLLVVLAHAGVPGMQAGFVGVDVFFVISGFLITGLLTQELQAKGRIDYWAFFGRRARRLAPALLVMVVTVCLAVLAWMPRPYWDFQLVSGFWALLWSSNIYFTFAGFDYFGVSASQSLFLHTWSLGVEEQFYLVWPFLVALAWKWGGTGARWLVLLSVVGFGAGLAILSADAQAAYYLMPARLWQLAAGGLAYRIAMQDPVWLKGFERVWALAGVGVLCLGLVLISEDQAYPGLWGLFPVAGSACLLMALAHDRTRVAGLLNAPIRLAGKISYSWYLWHWPLLMFLPALGLWEPSASERAGAVLLSFLLACASYAWVEQPFRRSRGQPRAAVVVAIATSLALAATLHWAPSFRPAGEDEASALLAEKIRADIRAPAIYGRAGCDQWYHSDELVPCEFAPAGPEAPVVVFIGDSIGAQWLPALEFVANERGLRLVMLTKSACPIVDEPIFYDRIKRRYTECEAWREKAIEHVRLLRPQWVVIGSAHYDFDADQWREGTRRILSDLSGAGTRVVVLAPTPLPGFHGPRCLAASGRLLGARIVDEACRSPLAEVDPGQTIQWLRDASEQQPGTAVLYMNDLVCPQGSCRAVIDGRVVFSDIQHLNASFVEDLAPGFLSRLQAALDEAGRR